MMLLSLPTHLRSQLVRGKSLGVVQRVYESKIGRRVDSVAS